LHTLRLSLHDALPIYNHYVPNLTIGPMVCEAIRPHVDVPIDVHLMVEPVDALIPMFAKAGANSITFHPEATRHVDRTLALIRDRSESTRLNSSHVKIS